jgi:N-acetylglutamate synthase-like GNAT family acetyltransferase
VPVLHPASSDDVVQLEQFLRGADLTTSGLDAPTVRLWIERDADGEIVGSTGFELSGSGRHALLRSVAVRAGARRSGGGTRLARFALDAAGAAGARTAWLFSRRSGPFWQRLGFESADRDALVEALPDAHQVRLFTRTGQLEREVAWSRRLPAS